MLGQRCIITWPAATRDWTYSEKRSTTSRPQHAFYKKQSTSTNNNNAHSCFSVLSQPKTSSEACLRRDSHNRLRSSTRKVLSNLKRNFKFPYLSRLSVWYHPPVPSLSSLLKCSHRRETTETGSLVAATPTPIDLPVTGTFRLTTRKTRLSVSVSSQSSTIAS